MHNIDGARLDCREFLEVSQQRYISQIERFCVEFALDVWKHILYVYESTFSNMEQDKSKKMK